ncbi:MAG TPA: hypothetical protein VMN37_10715, partial [Gemmatimonadales bacterium]|nr:hypothetical protein [Gemmatimonadales bacterium]
TFAAAWARRAVAYGTLYANSVPDPDAAAIALASAERARALAPDRPDGYNALSNYYQAIRHDGARSLEQAELGLKLAPKDSDLLVRAALARMTLGQWEAAIDVLRRSQATDPRSVMTPFRLARALLWLRRYDESLRASEQGLRLAPGHLGLVDIRAMTFAARGDLEGAREVIRQGAAHGDPPALFAYMAQYYDMFWLLDESQRNLLYRLPQSQFDDNPASRGLALAGAYTLDRDRARARAFADTARAALEAQIRDNPDDAQLHVLRGIALAYLGRKADAILEGRRGAAMIPPSRHALTGPYLQHQLARIYILVGEPDQALDQLEPLLTMPYFLSPGWLGVDPTFESLRAHPRFQRLLETSP